MRKTLFLGLVLLILSLIVLYQINSHKFESSVMHEMFAEKSYWFLLHRKSNVEYLYFGEPGNKENSAILKKFKVKTGIPGERPTPLPDLVGREYWLIISKWEVFDNPETAPYFLTLDIPVTENPPFGPEPYLECNGQCNWELPGAFGLHGNSGDPEKLAESNPGSSGCIRHTSEDITYLYNLLNPEKQRIRYYVEDV